MAKKNEEVLSQAQIKYAMKRIDEIVNEKISKLSPKWRDSDYVIERKYYEYLRDAIATGREFKFLKEAFVEAAKKNSDNLEKIWDYLKIGSCISFEQFKKNYKENQDNTDKIETLKKDATRLKDKLMFSKSSEVLEEINKLDEEYPV